MCIDAFLCFCCAQILALFHKNTFFATKSWEVVMNVNIMLQLIFRIEHYNFDIVCVKTDNDSTKQFENLIVISFFLVFVLMLS